MNNYKKVKEIVVGLRKKGVNASVCKPRSALFKNKPEETYPRHTILPNT